MKKKILSIVALLALTAVAHADGLVISDTSGQKNGTAIVTVELENVTASYRALLFDLALPDGVSVVYDEYGDPQIIKGERLSGKYSVSGNHLASGNDRFGVINTTDDEAIAGESGAVFSFTVALSNELSVGSTLTASVLNIKLTDANATDHALDAFTFNITVEEVRIILDENATTMPEASDNAVDVRVRRTIKANEWSTIVLPFAMTTAQTKAAFGADVELADFKGYDVQEDDGGDVVGITVNFSNGSVIEANHPYIIKVSEAVSEFSVDGVIIEPEEEPVVATIKRTRKQWSELIGSYVANTIVPEKTLFLNGNKFWYSTGSTKMKGYRAYFDFYDVLTDVDDNYVRMTINIDGEETRIDEIVNSKSLNSKWFDLSGRQVTKLKQHGVYVLDGKKVIVK